jgi:AmmeMemoRadiSam system protein B/AmmeMemoRadiSam system protein A
MNRRRTEGRMSSLRVLAPQVAGRFYPAGAADVRALLQDVWTKRVPARGHVAKAIIAPHAGLIFSGPVAASAFAAVDPTPIRRVVIAGPAHRARLSGIVTTSADACETPLGRIVIDPDLRRLAGASGVNIDDAPFRGEHSIETLLPFVQARMAKASVLPLIVGDASADHVARVLRSVWGGPDTLVVLSSDLSHFLDHDAARTSDAAARAHLERLSTAPLGGSRACGHRVLDGFLSLARDLDLRVTGLDLRTSADTQGHPARVVGYGAFLAEHAASACLPDNVRTALLDLAADALRFAEAHAGATPPVHANGPLPAALTAERATFVTLMQSGRLRGCIGSLGPHRPLVADVVVNAVKAGFADPRFPRLTRQEIGDLSLSISILSHPRPMRFVNEADLLAQIRPDIDGLILTDQGRSGLFLPSVWEGIPDVRTFWQALKRKAGLPPDHWSGTLTVRRFTTESFGRTLSAAVRPARGAVSRAA